MTHEIPFTQFCLPDGRQKPITIERPKEIADAAFVLMGQGYKFEIEVLTTGQVSMEIVHHGREHSAAMEIVTNGPDVPSAVDKLVNDAVESVANYTPEQEANNAS